MCERSFRCDGRAIRPAPDVPVELREVTAFFRDWQPDNRTGRKPLMAGTIAGRSCLARRFYHGGLLRHLLRDRYIGRVPRAETEMAMLVRLGELGLPVPRPIFAWTEPAGIGYRQGLVTELIPDAVDLAALDDLPPTLLTALVALLERFFDAGLLHPDLNIKNVLVRSDAGEKPEMVLLDFDRARLMGEPVPLGRRVQMYRRMFRSFDKMGRLGAWDRVPPDALPGHVADALAGYRKIRRWRALFWMLNRK